MAIAPQSPFRHQREPDGDAGAAGRDFLGCGWSYPPAFGLRGVAMSACEEKVAESIRIILGTARGERVMRPEFGCGIHDLVFEVVGDATLTLITAAVREALILWEPRVELLDVSAEPAPPGLGEGALVIAVEYRIRGTNNEFNLVYPFYLRQGA